MEEIEYKVTYDGGFWQNKGHAGKEIKVNREFRWGNEKWRIPSVYICGKGLVVDFCKEADPEEIKAYIDKWDRISEEGDSYTREQMEQMQSENPLSIEFQSEIILNGKRLQEHHGCGIFWLPPNCLKEEEEADQDAKRVLEHYGLDLSRGWSVFRQTFLWATKRPPVMKSLVVNMEQNPMRLSGIHFQSPSVGDQIRFTHPATGIEHTLHVHEYKEEELDAKCFGDEDMEYPTHYTAMTYTISPDIEEQSFLIQDYGEGDQPRRKSLRADELGEAAACSVAVIGGADGPTAIFVAKGNSEKMRVACSSLYFEKKSEIEWQMLFYKKMMEDIGVTIIG